MRAEDATILIIPGLGGSGPSHWQSRWESGLKTARRVEQESWDDPDRDGWSKQVRAAVTASKQPVILVAHSLGVLSAVDAVLELAEGSVVGGFLVAPPDAEDRERVPLGVTTFAPVPRHPLPFPSILVASQNDPYCAFSRSQAFAAAWGATLIDAGDAGHLNPESGHGPWPEGLLLFARLLAQIGKQGKRFDG